MEIEQLATLLAHPVKNSLNSCLAMYSLATCHSEGNANGFACATVKNRDLTLVMSVLYSWKECTGAFRSSDAISTADNEQRANK